MSGHDPTLKNKVSPHIQSQLPEFVQSDHPLFSLFLKYYYEFLEAGELVVSGSNSYVIEETISKNFILDETGENIVLEESVGKFVVGETITGSISGATARILVDDFDNNNRLFITSQQRFETGETLTGGTSGATSTVVSYRGNPVQNIQQLLAYADVDNTVYDFLDKFRDSFMESIPNTLADGLAKRKLVKNIKDMYAAKGTADGHKLFFRILFDEEPTIVYPRDNLLRPSDGTWSRDSIIRITENSDSDFNTAIGQRITGATSGATALIGTVIKFREGATLIAELNVDTNSITGTFSAGENITTTDTVRDLEISGVVKSIVTDGTVTAGGAYYTVGDNIVVGSGGNDAAVAKVESAGTGSVDRIVIENGGSGYSINDTILFNTTDTGGTAVSAKIVVVGGGFILEGITSPDHFITEDGFPIITEDALYLHQETTVGEDDFLVLEDGGQIIIEEETFNDLGVSSEIGEITSVNIINPGNGFSKLPLVSITTSTGAGASLLASSVIEPRIGHVEGISISNFGLDYNTAPTLTFNKNVLISNVSGTFIAGDTLTSHQATVVTYDSNTQILQLRTDVVFNAGDTITSVTGATATIRQSDEARGTSTIGVVGNSVAGFVNDRGKVSVNTMRIQDSFFYQDYSYVVRIGESINQWRESIRRSVHPAGWNVFGEVSFASQVSANIQIPTAGDVADNNNKNTFSPELASTFTNLFTTIFGRRLATPTQKALNASPKVGVDSPEDLLTGQRDVTLTKTTIVSLKTNRGSHWTGHTSLANLPIYAFAVPPIGTDEIASNYLDPAGRRITTGSNQTRDLYPIKQFGHYTIKSVSDYSFLRLEDGLDGDGDKIVLETATGSGFLQDEVIDIPDTAYTTRINVPPPSEITISRGGLINSFDNDFIKFDDGIQTFDESDGVGTERDTEGRHATSFDQGGTLGVKFDQNSVTFDTASGNEQDFEVKTFDESDDTFDVSTNTFDASNTIGRISLFSNNNTTFDKTTETYDTQ